MKAFSITYDYLCPFARVANEAVVEALDAGADYDVRFVPFSLTQNHLEDGAVPVWDRPAGEGGSGVLAHLWALAVRDSMPAAFRAFHVALFNARHDDGLDVNDPAVLASVAVGVGLDPVEIESVVESGVPSKTLGAEHTAAVDKHSVFGVPTFIIGEEAVFVRLMDRHALADLDRVIDMVGWTNVNEFKRTTIPR